MIICECLCFCFNTDVKIVKLRAIGRILGFGLKYEEGPSAEVVIVETF